MVGILKKLKKNFSDSYIAVFHKGFLTFFAAKFQVRIQLFRAIKEMRDRKLPPSFPEFHK